MSIVMSLQYFTAANGLHSSLLMGWICLLVSCLAAPSVSAQNEYLDYLIESEGPFVEFLYDSQADHPHDMPKCRPYIGDNPNNVRIWVSERLGDSGERALQGAEYFIKNSLRDHVVARTMQWASADSLAAANVRSEDDLRKLICNNAFAARPAGFDTALLVIGAVPDPSGGNEWVLGDAELGIHREKQVFFVRLNEEHLADGNHGRDWLTGESYGAAFWGGVIAHQVLHTLGFEHEEEDPAAFVYEYGRALSRMEVPDPVADRVFPPREPDAQGSFGHAGACARGAEPRGPYMFVRGDVDASGVLDITDAIRLLGMLFGAAEGPSEEFPACGHALDANDDDELDISDAIRVLTGLFLDGGMLPPAPYPAPGEDLTGGNYWGDCLYDFSG